MKEMKSSEKQGQQMTQKGMKRAKVQECKSFKVRNSTPL
jgi:hypothetical protein